jgi:endonuclease YncB( thermonuclease family)
MQSACRTLLVLIGLAAAASCPLASLAQSPAIFAPGLDKPTKPGADKPPETLPPKVTEKIIVNPGEVAGRAQVLGGDTLRLNQTTYRLWGVAAPPMNEFGGYTAMQGLAALIGSRIVICAPRKDFRGGLQTAQCRVAGGHDLAAEMVRRGFARDCPRQSGAAFAAIERTAAVDVAGGYKLPDECVAPF